MKKFLKKWEMTIIAIITFLVVCYQSYGNEVIHNTLQKEGIHYINNRTEESKYGISSWLLKDFNKKYSMSLKVKDLKYDQALLVADVMIYEKSNIYMINNINKQKVTFDFIYHSGKGKKKIQRVLNDYVYSQRKKGVKISYISEDGVFGPKTIAVINMMSEKEFCKKVTIARLMYVRSLREYYKYGDGWENRIKNVI